MRSTGVVEQAEITSTDLNTVVLGEAITTGGMAALTVLTLKNGDVAEAVASGAMTVSFAGITLRSLMKAYTWEAGAQAEDVREAGQQ